MQEIDLLQRVRFAFINRALSALARGTGLRDDLRSLLESFYDQLLQAVETGDPAWLDTTLNSWAESQTQTDLESRASGLAPFIKELILTLTTVCHENLAAEEAIDVISIIMPVFTYAFEKSAQLEITARVNYITKKLNETWQALQRLDESKSQFISLAAHELKTPLTLVDGYSAMLKDFIIKRGDAGEVMLINGIASGAKRLQAIIDDMITVSQIDNDLLQLHFQPLWLNRLLSGLAADLAETLKERKQTLEILAFPGSDELTFADADRLKQVFRNVLANAVKYTPDGGHIRVDGRKLPGFVEVLIIDNGIGIDQEDQMLIFNKFSLLGDISLHSSGKTKFKGGGPGLGLHIARGILDAHGGAIWVESPGRDEKTCPGSTFHLLFPMRTEPPDEQMSRLFAPLTQSKKESA